MLLFATSDKGGTGRSVTSCNLAYRRALQGSDVCYLDFDFGSPTAGAVLQINSVEQGTTEGGLHSYLRGDVAEPHRIDVWSESSRNSLRARPPGAGRLVLYPGDLGGGEFANTPDTIRRCMRLLLRMEEEFELCLVDLSAGRSYATEMVLAATAEPEFRSVTTRWLVFHRWTRQHVTAAADLVFGERGIIAAGVARGHDRNELTNSIRFVRTVVTDPNAPEQGGLRAPQQAWLRDCNTDLQRLASRCGIGRTVVLGQVPLDPVLQWHEQLITDNDVVERQIANRQTMEAFINLAKRLTDDAAWMGL
ncbi:MAG TPA: SCO2523 family variant P-loop protein [Natronosporangium sp.]